MEYYFAPMEGLTDAIYRRLHHKYYPGVHRYYMPFFSPTVHRSLTPRERRELPPAGTDGLVAVPQIMTKTPADFVWAAEQCAALGYDEVNLNLGCPSGTVVSKGKGAGMLRDLEHLRAFFDEIFRSSPLPISLKTRLGLESPEEFPPLLALFNQYPAKLLILHPRVRQEFYKGSVHEDWAEFCFRNSRNPVCYNGDLQTKEDIAAFQEKYPQINRVMIGRGLIGNPALLTPGAPDRETLTAFCMELLDAYRQCFGSDRNAMFRMKENWFYLLSLFYGSEKLGKQLRKTTDYGQFQAITLEILETLPFQGPFV